MTGFRRPRDEVDLAALDPPDIEQASGRVVAAVMTGATALVVLQLIGLVSSHTSTRLRVVDLTVAAVGLALLPALVRRPVAAAVVLGPLAALSPTATPLATMAAFQVAGWRRFRVAAGSAVIGIAAHLVLGWWRPVTGLPFGWYALLVVITYATLVGWGAFVQARRHLLRELASRLRRAEEEQAVQVARARRMERTRLAREMHDVLAHRLSLLATYSGALEYRPDASPERLAQAAGVIRAGVRDALQELREVITLLRDDEEPDGTGSLRPLPSLIDLPRLVDECEAAGMRITARVLPDAAADLPAQVSRTAFRVIQEGLTNARRHAPGQPVTLTVARPGEGELAIDVDNPAAAGAAGPSTREAGHGLVGLAERVDLVQGVLTHDIVDGQFRLHAHFHWSHGAASD